LPKGTLTKGKRTHTTLCKWYFAWNKIPVERIEEISHLSSPLFPHGEKKYKKENNPQENSIH
jgi:hypothetical protein